MEQSNRWKKLIEKHGSEEAAKAEMRRRAENSSRNKGKQGGFHALKRDNPRMFKEIASRGGKKTAQKISAAIKDSTTSEDSNKEDWW